MLPSNAHCTRKRDSKEKKRLNPLRFRTAGLNSIFFKDAEMIENESHLKFSSQKLVRQKTQEMDPAEQKGNRF